MIYKLASIVWTSHRQLRMAWWLLNNNRVPTWQKVIPFIPVIYLLSPFNLFTFAVPVLGQLDDMAVILLALQLFERVVDEKIVQEYHKTHDADSAK